MMLVVRKNSFFESDSTVRDQLQYSYNGSSCSRETRMDTENQLSSLCRRVGGDKEFVQTWRGRESKSKEMERKGNYRRRERHICKFNLRIARKCIYCIMLSENGLQCTGAVQQNTLYCSAK